MDYPDKMRLIEELTQRIMTVGRVKEQEFAAEIARRWIRG